MYTLNAILNALERLNAKYNENIEILNACLTIRLKAS